MVYGLRPHVAPARAPLSGFDADAEAEAEADVASLAAAGSQTFSIDRPITPAKTARGEGEGEESFDRWEEEAPHSPSMHSPLPARSPRKWIGTHPEPPAAVHGTAMAHDEVYNSARSTVRPSSKDHKRSPRQREATSHSKAPPSSITRLDLSAVQSPLTATDRVKTQRDERREVCMRPFSCIDVEWRHA